MSKVSEKRNTSGSSKRGVRNRKRGHNYELKIIKELKDITGNDNLCSSRLASKALDNEKIDIYDPDNVLNFYVQAKATQATPQFWKIIDDCGLKDKPLAVFWNKQEPREKKQISVGEYVMVQKDFFYSLIKQQY